MTKRRPRSLIVLLHTVMMQCCNSHSENYRSQNHKKAQTDESNIQMLTLTLTAEHAILQVTEDSSFRVFWSKGTKSTRDRGLPGRGGADRGVGQILTRYSTGQQPQQILDTLTCCTPHTGQPGVDIEACLCECGLYDGSTEDGCGPSDLWVPVVNEAEHITDKLLLCKDTT